MSQAIHSYIKMLCCTWEVRQNFKVREVFPQLKHHTAISCVPNLRRVEWICSIGKSMLGIYNAIIILKQPNTPVEKVEERDVFLTVVISLEGNFILLLSSHQKIC
jgi:hypothetical protein